MRPLAAAGTLFALASAGCDAESRACRSQFADTQALVTNVKSESAESVRGAVAALDAAILTCEKAELGHERSELQKARHQLAAHLEVLERRARRKKKAKPTPEELAELVAKGDPTCPKGQAYLQGTLKQEIRCTGAQLVELGFADVQAYFEDRKYKLTTSDNPPKLRAEYGAELYEFVFAKPNDAAGARCVSIYPAPGVSWQELVSKLTGVAPDKLAPGKPLKSARGPLPLSVQESQDKVVARVGDCS